MLTVVILLSFCALISCAPQNSSFIPPGPQKFIANEGRVTPMLKFLAFVDGKSYFGDYGTLRTWVQAKEYCISNGMKFAAISSEAQFVALKTASEYSNDFYGSYWTSARDSFKINQYVWDDTEEELSPANVYYENHFGLPYQTCLVMYSQGQSSYLYSYFCNDHGDMIAGVLCET